MPPFEYIRHRRRSRNARSRQGLDRCAVSKLRSKEQNMRRAFGRDKAPIVPLSTAIGEINREYRIGSNKLTAGERGGLHVNQILISSKLIWHRYDISATVDRSSI